MIRYLEEIGVKEEANVDSRLYSFESDEGRSKYFEKQREEYGFDERETWDLGYSLICWLYTHLSMYKEYAGAVIDFDFYTFDIEDLDGNVSKCTQGECIDLMLGYFKDYLKYENKESNMDMVEESKEAMDAQAKVERGLEILKQVLYYMWW